MEYMDEMGDSSHISVNLEPSCKFEDLRLDFDLVFMTQDSGLRQMTTQKNLTF